MLSLWLLACTSTHPCAPDELVTDEGDCVGPGGGGKDRPQDTDTGGEPLTLADNCDALDDLDDDPLWMTGQVRLLQQNPGEDLLVELIDVALDGDRGYGAGQGGLQVYDISDRTSPSHTYTWPDNGFARFHRVITLSEGLVAVSNRDMGVWVADVSRESEGVELTMFNGSGMEGLAWDGASGTLYVTRRDVGLLVLDPDDDWSNLEVHDTVSGLSSPWSLTDIEDGWMYAADATRGVVPIDVSEPRAPVVHGGIFVPGEVQDVALYEGVVYAAQGGLGIAVLDASTPSSPSVVTTVETGGSVVQVAAANGVLWAADHDGIMAFDLSDPLDPVQIHRETSEQFALGIDADDEGAWIGDWNLFSGFAVDSGATAPKADLPATRVFVPAAGGETEVVITNRGAGPLVLAGASVNGATADIVVDRTRVPVGETATLTLTTSGAIDATLCVSTNDPDDPVQELTLQSTDGTTLLGQKAPNFCLPDVDGKNWCLEDQLGKPVVLAYFATW